MSHPFIAADEGTLLSSLGIPGRSPVRQHWDSAPQRSWGLETAHLARGLVSQGRLAGRVPYGWWIPQAGGRMHALRHFYASTVLAQGVSIKELAEYLGHSDPGFTLRTYTRLVPSSYERARMAIDGVSA